MASTNDTITTILVEGTDGEALLWLETDADGVTTLNDANTAVPFDPNEENIEDAVKDWKRAVGMIEDVAVDEDE